MILAILACLSSLLGAPQEEENDLLVVNVLGDGTIKIHGKVIFRPNPSKPLEQDTKKLADLFEFRRQQERYQVVKGESDLVNYAVLVRAERSTPFHYIQLVLMTASMHGGVTKIQFARLREAETEGKLLSHLPKDKGLATTPGVEIQEVRIVLCAADSDEKERERHTVNKGLHDANLETMEQADLERTAEEKPAHLILNDVCFASVEKVTIGPLYKSWVCKEEKHREETKLDVEKRSAENKARYKAVAEKTKELYDITPGKGEQKSPVILDADSAVPYEHVLGVIDALKNVGIENVEFVANPRWEKGYGEKDPFKEYREDKKK